MTLNPNGVFVHWYLWAFSRPKTFCSLAFTTLLATILNTCIIFLLVSAGWISYKFGFMALPLEVLRNGGSNFEAYWMSFAAALTFIVVGASMVGFGTVLIIALLGSFIGTQISNFGKLTLKNQVIAATVARVKDKTCTLIEYKS